MAPTPYAQALAEPVAQALDSLHRALNVRASFDPATSQRCCTLALTDVGEIYFLPVLMDTLSREAPGVTLRCVPVSTSTLREGMASGQVDLALGWRPPAEAGIMQQALFRQRYVALMRQGHPLAAQHKVGTAAYRRARHVRVVSPGTGHALVDEELERLGMRGQVKLSVPHYVALGYVLASDDLVATVPERLAERTGSPFGLVSRPLTAKLPTSIICQLWHSHLQRDPGHQWLRNCVASLFGHSGIL